MVKNYDDLAKTIIENVGGKENIKGVSHCVTRLRFKLKNEEKANTEMLKKLDGVVTVVQNGGQYHIVIGNHVPEVYATVIRLSGIKAGFVYEETSDKQNIVALIDTISGVFAPIIGCLAATGMIKGLITLLVFLGWMQVTDGAYIILYGLAEGFFHFLPVILGYTSAQKFGGNLFIGLGLGASMMYLQDVTMINSMEVQKVLFKGTAFQMQVYATFLGLPITWPVAGYASSVVPIILSVYMAVKVEKFFKKYIPDVVQTFLVPMLTFMVATPLTFLLVGPIASLLTSFVNVGVTILYVISPIATGLVLGGIWQILVIFGLHWGIIPIGILYFTSNGYDPLIAITLPASFAQIAVVLAILFKTKDLKLKSIAIPAFISGIFGVTETAIYGVTLPKKKPFYISCVGAAIAGAIVGAFEVNCYALSGLGVLAIPGYIKPATDTTPPDASGVIYMLIAITVAMVVGFVLTWVTYKDDETTVNAEDKEVETKTEVKATTLFSPLSGEVIDVKEVRDSVFASGALGKGVAINPTSGVVVSPVDGKVKILFKTNHAIGLVTETGAEILIHIGIDTVQLDGKHFNTRVSKGDEVVVGQPLIEFNIEEIEKAGFSVMTPVVITNSDDFIDIVYETGKIVNIKDELMQLL